MIQLAAPGDGAAFYCAIASGQFARVMLYGIGGQTRGGGRIGQLT